jgi:hypothetical protein
VVDEPRPGRQQHGRLGEGAPIGETSGHGSIQSFHDRPEIIGLHEPTSFLAAQRRAVQGGAVEMAVVRWAGVRAM